MLYRAALFVGFALAFAGCAKTTEDVASVRAAQLNSWCNAMMSLSKETIGRYDRNADRKLDKAEYGLWVADAVRGTSMRIDVDAGFTQQDGNSDGFIDVDDMARIPSGEGGAPHSVTCPSK